MTGAHLRDYRHLRGLTQRALAAMLGVSPNTVARWERNEVPIPALVAQFFVVFREAQEQVIALQARHQKALDDELAGVRRLSETIRRLKSDNDRLKDDVKLLRIELKHAKNRRATMASWERWAFGSLGIVGMEAFEKVYKRLSCKYHPDRNHHDAEVMKDLNELRQSLKNRA